jgi:hypothetical protein
VHNAVFPSAVAFIVVEPGPTAVTLPVELTVATDVFVDDQVTVGYVALAGATVAVRVLLLPTKRESVDAFSVTDVTAILLTVT